MKADTLMTLLNDMKSYSLNPNSKIKKIFTFNYRTDGECKYNLTYAVLNTIICTAIVSKNITKLESNST